MAFQNQNTTWGNTQWVSFQKGPRIYYSFFTFSMDGKTIKYGSTIYKQEGQENIRMENHFQTAKDRFERFPVVASVSKKIIQKMDTHKTRRAKTVLFESKDFQSFLIQNFVQHGVRLRQGKESYSSLRKKILENRQAILNKKKNTLINKTKAKIHRSEKERKMMIQGFNPQEKGFVKIEYSPENLPEINSNLTYNMVIWEEGKRIYHVDIQHDPNTGKARYGACVFKSASIQECQNYDREIHIDTAVDRFENFPILAFLPLNYQGQNKRKMSKGEFPLNQENIQIIKKAMCIFGARQRNIKDNFLKKQEILQNQESNLKKLNRLQQSLDYDLSCYRKNKFQHQMETNRQQWIKFTSLTPIVAPAIAMVAKVAEKCNNVIQKASKIVFMDTPPIVLNKNKKIPTPPNSPRIQKIEDHFDQYLNIKKQKKQKTNKGYKNKTQSAQKRKATENYKQEIIAKERMNAEKTKDKINRRATILV
jgi:hypothetical protein